MTNAVAAHPWTVYGSCVAPAVDTVARPTASVAARTSSMRRPTCVVLELSSLARPMRRAAAVWRTTRRLKVGGERRVGVKLACV